MWSVDGGWSIQRGSHFTKYGTALLATLVHEYGCCAGSLFSWWKFLVAFLVKQPAAVIGDSFREGLLFVNKKKQKILYTCRGARGCLAAVGVPGGKARIRHFIQDDENQIDEVFLLLFVHKKKTSIALLP